MDSYQKKRIFANGFSNRGFFNESPLFYSIMKGFLTISLFAGIGVMALSSCSTDTNVSGIKILSKNRVKRAASASWTEKSPNGFHPAPANTALLQSVAHLPKDKHGMPTYRDDTTHRVVRTTAYSHMENEPGAPGRMNAAGGILKYGQVRSAAADWSKYPVGTKFRIKGLPYLYVVDDYGSALTGTNTIDIFHPSLKGMNKWGTRPVEIDVVQWGSWERTLNLLKGRTRYWHCRDMYTASLRKIRNGEVAAGLTNPTKPQG